MSKIIAGIKNLLLNRNTVVILATIAGVIVLWFIYNSTLTKAINPKRVPVAKSTLTAGTVITSDDISYVEVSNDFLKKVSVITNTSQLVNYYVNNGTTIQQGAMFYTSQVVSKDELVKRDTELVEEGNTIYWLKVDNTTTYANSIYPGDNIDLWLKVKNKDTDGLIVYEEFITCFDVLSVKDDSGKDVFDGVSNKTPAWLAFSVSEEMYQLLYNIGTISDMQLYPVPKNKTYSKGCQPISSVNDIENKKLLTLIQSYVK
jgi:hypothetical protein